MEYLQYLSIHNQLLYKFYRFKPCYKWNTFNTLSIPILGINIILVLNLVINGIPSIQKIVLKKLHIIVLVLNLVINGIPSIQFELDF